jgi:hypothetical protein
MALPDLFLFNISVQCKEMALSDIFLYNICVQCKEMALSEPDPELFTIATLTGHACLGKVNSFHRYCMVVLFVSSQ